MSRTEIRITGLGGQGSVLAGYIIGRAYSIEAGHHASMMQSFGPEARGSACSATLSLSEEEVLYPYIKRPDLFVVMSNEGYVKYKDELKDEGTLIYESDLVTPEEKKGQGHYGVPSIRIAEGIGRTIVQNIVMLGFITGVTGIVSADEMRRAVKDSVPPGTEDMNLKAFEAGYDYYQEHYGGGEKDAAPEATDAGAGDDGTEAPAEEAVPAETATE